MGFLICLPYLKAKKSVPLFSSCMLAKMVAKPHKEGERNDVSVWMGHYMHKQQIETLHQHNKGNRVWSCQVTVHISQHFHCSEVTEKVDNKIEKHQLGVDS